MIILRLGRMKERNWLQCEFIIKLLDVTCVLMYDNISENQT